MNRHLAVAALLPALALSLAPPAAAQGRIVASEIRSNHFAGSRIGISPLRRINVYLPRGYDASGGRRYPVIYYLNHFFETEATPWESQGAKALLDDAIARGLTPGFIFVTADFSTPAGSSWYVNSPATGDWADFMTRELVPHVDARYRTIADRNSRGLLGDGAGGYGAIRFGMEHPEMFGAVYAMQPLGTGASLQPTHSRADFDLLARARSLDDLGGDGFSRIFTAIYQAFSPNPDRPPLFFDPPVRQVAGKPEVDAPVLAAFHARFALAGLVPAHAEALKSLRGLKFDWGRADTIHDHIAGAQALARQLAEYGVPHEAEEHSGGFRDRHWGESGRVLSDALPFFARNLIFARAPEPGSAGAGPDLQQGGR